MYLVSELSQSTQLKGNNVDMLDFRIDYDAIELYCGIYRFDKLNNLHFIDEYLSYINKMSNEINGFNILFYVT